MNLKTFATRTALVGVGFAGAVYLSQLGKQFILSDPLARYRQSTARVDTRPAIELKNVSFRQYSGSKFVSRATIDQVSVTADRQVFNLKGIKDGEYHTAENKQFQYNAALGVWNQVSQSLSGRDGVQVRNPDLNLTSSSFEYNRRTGLLHVPNNVTGKLFDGDAVAMNLFYEVGTGAFEIGPISWVGSLKQDQELPAARTNQRWTIKASGASRPPGDVEIWRNAEATDGEVIVKADRIERNVKTDVIVATGNVRHFDKDANLICDKVTVYRKEKRAVLEGTVSMLIKPEEGAKLEVVEIQPLRPVVPESLAATRPRAPERSEQEKQQDDEVRSADSKRKYPVAVLAGRVEYWYARGQKRAVITGNPQARQDMTTGRWRQAWCTRAVYDGEKETLRMESAQGQKDTRVKTSLGDDLRATWFLISTKRNEDAWEAEGLEGEVYPDDEEGGNRGGTQPPPGQKPPALRGRIGQ